MVKMTKNKSNAKLFPLLVLVVCTVGLLLINSLSMVSNEKMQKETVPIYSAANIYFKTSQPKSKSVTKVTELKTSSKPQNATTLQVSTASGKNNSTRESKVVSSKQPNTVPSQSDVVSKNEKVNHTDTVLVEMPEGFINKGWNWISLPVLPVDRDAAAIFGEDVVEGKLYRLNPHTKEREVYGIDFWDMEMGRGYLLFYEGDEPLEVKYLGIPEQSQRITYLSKQGFNLIGLPIGEEVLINDLVLYHGEEVRTAAQDYESENPWINWHFIYFNQNTESMETASPFGDDSLSIDSWRGYYVYSNVDSVTIEAPDFGN